jgi:hypothetical protein
MTINGVSAISGRHPDLAALRVDRWAHWVEINGQPVRTPQGGIVTYPDRHAAVFSAKCIARKRECDL